MATTQITLGYPAGTNIFRETVLQATVIAVKASSTTLYYIDIDNTANAAATYCCLWNVASGSVTIGTTAPDMIVMAPASTRTAVPIPAGIVFGTALTVANKTTAGTGGSTNPVSAVPTQLVYA